MNDDWARQMSRRLRSAAASPPTAQVIAPQVQEAATRAATLATARRKPARISVTVTDHAVRVDAGGPGAAQALATTRAELDRRRPAMVAKVNEEGLRRLRR